MIPIFLMYVYCAAFHDYMSTIPRSRSAYITWDMPLRASPPHYRDIQPPVTGFNVKIPSYQEKEISLWR